MSILEKFNDLGVRIASAIVLLLVAMTAFWYGGIWVASLIAALSAVMCWEFARLTGVNPFRFMIVMVVAAVGSIVIAFYFGWKIALLILLIGALGLYRPERKAWLWSALGFLYISGAALAVFTVWQTGNGIFNIFWLVLVVMLSDIGGYFAGRIIGGPKLWPKLSPKKTWSGTLGGWLLAAIAGIFIGLFTSYSVVFAIVICMILTVAAQAGDLLESWVKRRQGVKDASNLIPGHGGFLDRFDGLLAAALAFVAIPGIW